MHKQQRAGRVRAKGPGDKDSRTDLVQFDGEIASHDLHQVAHRVHVATRLRLRLRLRGRRTPARKQAEQARVEQAEQARVDQPRQQLGEQKLHDT